jgi:hypothetical protein
MLEERFLNECYDNFSREELRLLNDLKSDKEPSKKKEKDVHRQVKLLNALMAYTLRLRSLKQEINGGNIFS